MKNQTIGVEIEMNNITRESAARLVADYFGSQAYYEGGCYSTWHCKDSQGRNWRFVRDSSIIGPDSEKCEMVTPILHYDDIETLQEIVRLLRKNGAKSDASRGCGVHIHIGANGFNASSLRNLVNIMASHEDLIANALSIPNSRLYRWCEKVNTNFLVQVNDKKPRTLEKFADIWYRSQGEVNDGRHYNTTRYHMLNLHAVFTKGTVEFRMFNFDEPADGKLNGLHAGQLKSWIQFCLAICHLAKTVRCASPIKAQVENPKYAMRTWLLRLGFIGDEFATARDVLTSRLSGNGAWR